MREPLSRRLSRFGWACADGAIHVGIGLASTLIQYLEWLAGRRPKPEA